jgi:ATP-dependent Zn protease
MIEPQPVRTRKRKIAIHEAGHAVVARMLGIGVTHVAMFSTDGMGRAGAQTISAAYAARNADLPTQLSALEADIKVTLAGPLASQRHYPAGNRKGWVDDLFRAKSYAAMAALLKAGKDVPQVPAGELQAVTLTTEESSEACRLLERLWAETETLVAANWSAIMRAAEALLQQPMLSESELDRLIAKGL